MGGRATQWVGQLLWGHGNVTLLLACYELSMALFLLVGSKNEQGVE